MIDEAFERYRTRAENAKILPKRKKPQKKKEFIYAQIRNIIMHSEPYVASYNTIIKLATNENFTDDCRNKVKFTFADNTFNLISRLNDDALIQLTLLDLRKEPVIIQYPTIDSKYASLEISAFDHYSKIPLSTTKGDFKKPTTLLLCSKRTEDYAGQSVNGVDWYLEVDCDFSIALLRVLPQRIDNNNEIFSKMAQVKLTLLSQWLGKPAINQNDPHFPIFDKTDIEVFGTNLLEVMQFVMNHTTFDPSIEMDRALLRA